MCKKAKALWLGSQRARRGAVLLASCGLALAGWCAPAYDVAVLNSPTTLGQRLHREWVDFRADALSTVVREGSRRARLAKPGIVVSACGQEFSLIVDGGRKSGVWYEKFSQATPLWLKKGWVDYVCAMDYMEQTFDSLRETASRQDSVARGRVFPGIGMAAWIRPEEDSEKFKELLDAVRAAGCKGWCLYVLDDDRAEYHLPPIDSLYPPDVK